MDNLSSVTATASECQRLRLIDDQARLMAEPITADELATTAVLVRARARSSIETVQAMRELMPWGLLWTDHESWRTGSWRCVVDTENLTPRYTAYKQQLLRFHTDMSRYVKPPEITAIRSVVPDPGGGGVNALLHIDDALGRLAELGRTDIVKMLTRPRRLNAQDRHWVGAEARENERPNPLEVPIVVPGDPFAPCRIFDHTAATKGLHLEMSPEELRLFDEFLDCCEQMTLDLPQIRLDRGDVLVFSNWRFMHARSECRSAGRVTEISMLNRPAVSLAGFPAT